MSMQHAMFARGCLLSMSCTLLAGCPSGTDLSVGAQDLSYELEEAPATLNPATETTVQLRVVDSDMDVMGGSPVNDGPFIGVVGLALKLPLPDPDITGITVPFSPFDPGSIVGEGASALTLRADGDAPPAIHQFVVEGTLTNVSGLPESERRREFPVQVRVTAACVRDTMPATAIVAHGGERAGALTQDGSLYTWGANVSGEISGLVDEYVPAIRAWLAPRRVPLPAFDNLQFLTAGYFSVPGQSPGLTIQLNSLHAIRGGIIQSVGPYYQSERESPTGRAGIATDQVSGVPVPVVAVSQSARHSLAVGTDGTLWAWGSNFYGQLGNGSTDRSDAPVQVIGLSGVIAVVAISNAAGATSVAVRSDGTVWSWGLGGPYSLLGDGSTEDRHVPAPVPGLTDIIAISDTGVSVIALRRDGSVWTWGDNDFGQLGDGTRTRRLVPFQVLGLTDVVAIGANYPASFAVRRDGTLWGWGHNGYGMLGNGNDEGQLTPVQAGVDNVVAVSLGGNFTLALRRDGSVWAWGLNDKGQLGDGTTTNRLTPRPVLGFGPAGSNACDTPPPPSPPQFTLSVTKLGPTATVVFSTPVGIECGFACSAPFASGQSVRLRAAIPAGSSFSGWSGCDRLPTGTSTYPDCEVDMNADRTVQARVE